MGIGGEALESRQNEFSELENLFAERIKRLRGELTSMRKKLQPVLPDKLAKVPTIEENKIEKGRTPLTRKFFSVALDLLHIANDMEELTGEVEL